LTQINYFYALSCDKRQSRVVVARFLLKRSPERARLPVSRGLSFDTNMETKQALSALSALAQESRLAIFRLLVEHAPAGLAAGDIAGRLELAPPTLSFHLKELSHSGLIVGLQEGRFIWYSAHIAAMNDLIAYLAKNCCTNSAVCDPACAPMVASSSPTRIKLPATDIKRPPRKRHSA
jgi:ArsR family transcriptional regulator, arsenate/arsenite/antimonite-responsive transcriptional repressor